MKGSLFASILFAIAFAIPASAQEHAHAHDDSHGHDHDFELGVAPGLAYLPSESEVAPSLHLHLLAFLGDSGWATGVGFERIFDEHAHNVVNAVVEYHLTSRWTAALAPGIGFGDEDPGDLEPSIHVETGYEVLSNDIHLGPSVGFAADPHEVHVSLSLHLGIGF